MFNVGVADNQPIKIEPDEQDSVDDDKSDSGLSTDLGTHDMDEAEMDEVNQYGKRKYSTSATPGSSLCYCIYSFAINKPVLT